MGPQLVTASDLELGDVNVNMQIAAASTELGGRSARGSDALRVRYTIVAQRTSDQRSMQRTQATLAGNWRP